MSKLLDAFWARWEQEGIRNGNIVSDPEWTATATKSQLDEAFENRRKAQLKMDKLEWEQRKEQVYAPTSIHNDVEPMPTLAEVRAIKKNIDGLSYSLNVNNKVRVDIDANGNPHFGTASKVAKLEYTLLP